MAWAKRNLLDDLRRIDATWIGPIVTIKFRTLHGFQRRMSRKIFISYRREESGANALSIGQYLEKEFGQKNVFIDIDMHAGAKFPEVLEQRLADCKVMLALIGPEWLNARDGLGGRRLDNPNDWVRLEIARALQRDITVIPVLVNGAQLPAKADLPTDIQRITDHQAATVTMAGFRHEMAGLARDIHSIKNSSQGRRLWVSIAGVLVVLIGLVFAWLNSTGQLNRIRPLFLSQPLRREAASTDLWVSNPDEWVLFAVGTNPIATYYFKPSSVKMIGEKVSYATRFPLVDKISKAPQNEKFSATYEDDITVLDCKKSTWSLAERTEYSKSGKVLSHYNWGDIQTVNPSVAIPPRSILDMGKTIMCDAQIRAPVFSKAQLADISNEQFAKMNFSYLARSPNGQGAFFRGPKIPMQSSPDQFKVILALKYDQARPISEVLPPGSIVGHAANFVIAASDVRVNCTDRKSMLLKTEYFDPENDIVYLFAPVDPQPTGITQNSPLALLLNTDCGAAMLDVAGTYEGTNDVTFKGGHGSQRVSIVIGQEGSTVNVSFRSGSGAEGKATGALTGDVVSSLEWKSTNPKCTGSYKGSLKFSADTVSWSYKGKDCTGPEEGHGTAKKMK